MTEYTDNYGLNKYGDGDAANLRDQYNASMDIIDTQLKTANDNAAYAKPILNAAGLTDTAAASGSKTRWDEAASLAATNKTNIATIKTNIATIDANLNALHANTVMDASNLYNQIQKIDGGDIILFVGDSIVNGTGASSTGNRFSSLLASMLGLREVNHSEGGAGFVHISDQQHKTLLDCANEAIDDDSFDHSKVKYLILEGGINDNNAGDITNASNTVMSKLHTEFPSAKRYFMNTLTAGGETTANQSYINVGASGPFVGTLGIVGMYNIIHTAETAAYNNTFVPLNSWRWLSFENGFSVDGVHPNDAGHKRIANIMYGILNNGVMPPESRNVRTVNPPDVEDISGWIQAASITFGETNQGITFNKFTAAAESLPYGAPNLMQVVGNKLIINISMGVNISRTDTAGSMVVPIIAMPDNAKFGLNVKGHTNHYQYPYASEQLVFTDDSGTKRTVPAHYVYDYMANVIYLVVYDMGSGYTLTNRTLQLNSTIYSYIPFTYTYS